MRILVTGAGGYIGSVLVSELVKHGHGVVALDRFFFGEESLAECAADSVRVVKADIRTFIWSDEEIGACDAVIDLAAISNDPSGDLEPSLTWSINHLGRFRVASMARQAGVRRYILPSSCSVYGFQDGEITEVSDTNPLTTYAKANLQAEGDILSLASEDFCVTILRQATVFGLSPRMRFDLAVNGMVKGFGQNGKIPILRDGTQWRPFVHVRDIAKAMLTVLGVCPEGVNGQTYNVGSDENNWQIMPLAQEVASAIGVPFSHEWYGDPDHRSYRVSFAKIREDLGYTADWSVSRGAHEVWQGIKDGKVDPEDEKTITVAWYKKILEEVSQL